MTAISDTTTFIFLCDPQIENFNSLGPKEPRSIRNSELNDCLNNIASKTWPTGTGLASSIAGKPIDTPKFIIFGGDLCENGGEVYGAGILKDDWRGPPWFIGGFQLQMLRWLYVKNSPLKPSIVAGDWSGVTRTNYDTVYFGLGNHDLSDAIQPSSCVGVTQFDGMGRPQDYDRYQMTNFLAQCHTGVVNIQPIKPNSDTAAGVIPISNIDSRNRTWDFTQYSFNYRIDFNCFSIIQLHRYGGDNGDTTTNPTWTKANGLAWLTEQLAELGTNFPIIIVQHNNYGIDPSTVHDWSTWSYAEMQTFGKLIAPYNIIALLTGHTHQPLQIDANHGHVPVPVPQDPNKFFHEFTPGAAGVVDDTRSPPIPGGSFSIVRVGQGTFDIQHGIAAGSHNNQQFTWGQGFSKGISSTWTRVSNTLQNNNYTPGVGGGFLFDCTEVLVPPGLFLRGVQFVNGTPPGRVVSDQNNMSLRLTCSDSEGNNTTQITSDYSGPQYNNNGDVDGLYADNNLVLADPGCIVVGVKFFQWGNRAAVSVKSATVDDDGKNWTVNDKDDGKEGWIVPTAWNGHGFWEGEHDDRHGLANMVFDMNPAMSSGIDQVVVGAGIFQFWVGRIAPQLAVGSFRGA